MKIKFRKGFLHLGLDFEGENYVSYLVICLGYWKVLEIIKKFEEYRNVEGELIPTASSGYRIHLLCFTFNMLYKTKKPIYGVHNA